MCCAPYGAPGPMRPWFFLSLCDPRWGLDDCHDDKFGNRIMGNDGDVLHTLRGTGTIVFMGLFLSLCDPDGVWLVAMMMNMVTG